MKKLFLISFIAMFFVLSGTLVLGAEWDNVLNYDDKTETANISNSFLWVFPTSQIASAKLNTPHTVFVIPGKNRYVGEFTINMYDDYYQNFFTDMEVYNTKTGESIARRLDYKIKEVTYLPTYVKTCKDTGEYLKNGTAIQDCTFEVNGQTEVVNWKPLDTKDILKGNMTIGVFARNVYEGDSIEWIPKLGNVRIPQWAIFNASFNNSLLAWWNCSSYVESKYGQYNLSASVGTPVFNSTNALQNQSAQLPIGNSMKLADGTPKIEFTAAERNATLNLWFRYAKDQNVFFLKKYDGSGTGWYSAANSDGSFSLPYLGTCDWPAGSFTANNWTMVTFIHNDSGTYTFQNAIFKTRCAGTVLASTTALKFGEDNSGSYINGSFDEISIWNRSLTEQELVGLYDDQRGTTFYNFGEGGGGDPPDTTAPTVTLVAPANRTLTTNKTVSLNMTVTDDINVSKVGFFLWNETALINQTNYTTPGTAAYSLNLSVNLPHFGYFKWNYQAWDNATANNTAMGATNNTVTYYNISAVWNSATLESGLVAHYSFEETSGNLTDKAKGRYNHSISGHVGQTYPGIYGNAYYFNKSDPQLWTEYNMTGDINDLENVGGVSVNVWYNSGGFPSGASSTDQTQRVNIFTFGNGTDGNGFLNIGTYVNLPNQICIMTGGQASPPSDEQLACDQAKTNDNYWHMVTATINVTGAHLYVDGVFRNRSDKDFISEIFHGIDRMCFSRFCRLGNDLSDYRLWNGSIDEAGIWNRSLTSAEVLSLYNYGGSGNFTLTTESEDTTPPQVYLQAPSNYSNTTSATYSFNVTATDDINVSNMAFYIWNATSIVNQTNISTSGTAVSVNLTYVLPKENVVYSWNYQAFDNKSNRAFNHTNWSVMYYIPDTSNPILNITAPNGTINYFINGNNLSLNWTVYDLSSLTCGYYFTLDQKECYQETANVSTACGGLNSGTYSFDALGFDDNFLLYDGNWNTKGVKLGASASFSINYTPPVGATSNSKWMVKTENAFGIIIKNYTLGNYNCFNSDKIQVRVRYDGTKYEECYNGTDWYILNSSSAVDWGYNVAEETMIYEIATPVNCSLNTTSFNPGPYNTIYLYAQDSSGNRVDNLTTWSYNLKEEEQIYNATALETSNNTYILNLTFNSTKYSTSSATLVLNGTRYSSTKISTGDNTTFRAYVELPLTVINFDNYSIIWNVSLSGDADLTLLTTRRNQSVQQINLTACDAGIIAINATVYEESNSTRLKPFTFDGTFNYWESSGSGSKYRTYSYSNASMDELKICMSPNYTSLKTDATIAYDFGSYNNQYYYFDDQAISNITTNLSLYLIGGTTFIIKVQDNTFQPVKGAIVQIQRYNAGTNNYTTVQTVQTDDNGKTVGFYITETVDYRHIISKNGVTLLVTSKGKIVPETAPYTLTFTVGDVLDVPWQDFQNLGELTENLSYNNNTKTFTFAYTDTNANFSQGRLLVKLTNYDKNDSILCNSTSNLATASITCAIGSTNGTVTAYGFITRSTTESLVEVMTIFTQRLQDIFGKEGLFLAWFIILTAAMTGLWNPTVGIVITNVAIIFVNIIGIATFSPFVIFGILAISAILVVILRT